MNLLVRRALPLAVVAALLLSAVPPVAATTGTTDLAAAETTMVGLLNAQRTSLGLVPYRADTRLTAIARARSQDMISKNYFAHLQPDGRYVWDLMNQALIKWYYTGEIIGRTSGYSLAGSTTTVAASWKASGPHFAIVCSTTYNYFGVGVATDGLGKYVWTAVMIKGPDRTGAKSSFSTVSNVTATTTASTTSTVKHAVTLRWSGYDVKLQTLTAGLLDYTVQYRLSGATTWSTLVGPTSATSTTRYLYAGRIYEFRIRARDKKYNYGAWSATLLIKP